tara:strand:+ start:204 stop:713 length:510 start_codon:yes stop_codon:yes gene_type:complete
MVKKTKSKYKVIDNFLPQENFLQIKENLLGKDFPWYYFPDISFKNKTSKNSLFYMQHVLYNSEPNSSYYDFIKTNLLNFIDIKSLIRVKVNFYPNQGITKIDEMHIDYEYKHKGAIFSINTNNGATILKDGTKINSVENRILFFNPSEEHDSENCTDKKSRVNININYF